MWDNDILDAFNLQPGQRFVLGDAPNAWAFPRELLPTSHLPLVDYTHAKAEWCPSGMWLEPGTRAQVQFGSIRVIAWAEVPEVEANKRRQRAVLDRIFTCFGASAMAAAALLLAARYSVPELSEVQELPPDELMLGFPNLVLANEVPDEPSPEPSPTPARYVYPVKHGLTGNSPCGGERNMGTPIIAQGSRYGVRGPKDNPDPHLDRHLVERHWDYEGEPPRGTFGPLDTTFLTDSRAPTAPWARDSSLGTDEVSARGNMWGDDIHDADGEDGIAGLAHLDGGEVKAIDVQRPETATHPARVIHTQGHVKGPLPVAVVERALVMQLANFRECYLADPASTGNHEGRLELDFTVDTEGKIATPRIIQLEQVSLETAQCMLDRVKTLTFAKMDSENEITYPLLLVPSELPAAQAVARVELAPVITRTNDPVVPCGGTVRHRMRRGECKR